MIVVKRKTGSEIDINFGYRYKNPSVKLKILFFDWMIVTHINLQLSFLPFNKFKGSDQRKNRWVWSNVNTRYLVWRCGDGGSFAL